MLGVEGVLVSVDSCSDVVSVSTLRDFRRADRVDIGTRDPMLSGCDVLAIV